MNPEALERLLTKVQTGTLSVATAIGQLRTLPYENLGFASVDHHRSLRQGFPEVIFCEGKTSAQIRAIAKALLKHHRPLLATRATRQVAALIKRLDRRAVYHDEARIVSIRDPKRQLRGHVLVITAGTSDIPVAEEARVTAEVMGSRVETLYDVGVAGIHRLLERQSRLMQARVVVVVAGMDGVLPSVVGGLVPLSRRGRTDEPGLRREFRRTRCIVDDAELLRSRSRCDEHRQWVWGGLSGAPD